MAKELSRIKYETEREEKMRQYIRENRYLVYYHGQSYVHGNFTKLGFPDLVFFYITFSLKL